MVPYILVITIIYIILRIQIIFIATVKIIIINLTMEVTNRTNIFYYYKYNSRNAYNKLKIFVFLELII